MSKITAVIKCNAGAWEVRTVPPFGKEIVANFNAKNNFTVEIPKELTYVTPFGKVKVHHENWPQHLLDHYPYLELVELKEEKPIVASAIVDKRKKKGKENEKST